MLYVTQRFDVSRLPPRTLLRAKRQLLAVLILVPSSIFIIAVPLAEFACPHHLAFSACHEACFTSTDDWLLSIQHCYRNRIPSPLLYKYFLTMDNEVSCETFVAGLREPNRSAHTPRPSRSFCCKDSNPPIPPYPDRQTHPLPSCQAHPPPPTAPPTSQAPSSTPPPPSHQAYSPSPQSPPKTKPSPSA